MDLGLKGKVAIVTGGTKGIGSGTAEVLAQEGCNLALVYRSDEEGSQNFCKKLADAYGVEVLPVKADITDLQAVENMWKTVIDHYGTPDILINNAAGGSPRGVDFLDVTYEQWEDCMNGCLGHVFNLSQRFLKEIKKAGKTGHIVNISAKAAMRSDSVDKIPYATAKGAIATLTRRMAHAYIESGVWINAIVPGYVINNGAYKDPNNPIRQSKEKLLRIGWAIPEDMGNVITFLCSDKSRQVIGAVIDTSGGTMF